MVFIIGLCVIILAARAVLLRVDVRLALLMAATLLAVLAGIGDCMKNASRDESARTEIFTTLITPLTRVVRTFLTSFSDEKFVVPICLAMGFAYVLRETQCDQHLVRMLIKPFGRARSLFLPGAVITGVCVNVPLISQAASVAAAGTVLVPLGRALGFPPAIIGAALLLGCSIGGELLNPGSPEVRIVVEGVREHLPDTQPADSIQFMRKFLLWHALVSLAVFLVLNRSLKLQQLDGIQADFQINFVKAVIPFVPVILLALVSPPLQLWRIPPEYLLVDPSNKNELKLFDSRMIGAAMLFGVILAGCTAPRSAQNVTKVFFEGAGSAFASIIALIAAANCFGEGVRSVGITEVLGQFTKSWPGLFLPLAALIPVIFGCLSGSGIAATQSLFPLFLDASISNGNEPLESGAVVSIGAAAGRTMSPVSAVNLLTSKLTESNPVDLSWRVAPALLIGMVVVVLLAMLT